MLTLVTVGPVPANGAGALPSDKVTRSTILTKAHSPAIVPKEPSTATYSTYSATNR